MVHKCSCCGERDADSEFPGLTDRTRELRGRPVSTLCFIALLTEGKGAAELAGRIRARDSTLGIASFCVGAAAGAIVQSDFKPENARVFVAGQELKPMPLGAMEREG